MVAGIPARPATRGAPLSCPAHMQRQAHAVEAERIFVRSLTPIYVDAAHVGAEAQPFRGSEECFCLEGEGGGRMRRAGPARVKAQ